MEVTITLASRDEAIVLFGLEDRNLKLLRDTLGVKIAARNSLVRLQGDRGPLESAARILRDALSRVRSGDKLEDDHVERELRRLSLEGPVAGGESGEGSVEAGDPGEAAMSAKGAIEPVVGAPESDESAAGSPLDLPPRPLKGLSPAEVERATSLARSPGQKAYLEAMLRDEVVCCIGPAGTGKTFLAVHMAVHMLRDGVVRRLILCRPAVEAGEKLGFLPGDFQAKINPYLRPLYDALNEILNYDQVQRYIDREIIEIIPLAYMRGRTLNHAFIILDEGQNSTIAQMKMFLTRMGAHSRIVVNGDVTQIDLPAGQPSGLIHVRKVIQNIKGIAWVELTKPDIVRHPLVKRIVEAYESEARSDPGS